MASDQSEISLLQEEIRLLQQDLLLIKNSVTREILEENIEGRKVDITHLQTTPSESKYAIGDILTGKIEKITDLGSFIVVKDGSQVFNPRHLSGHKKLPVGTAVAVQVITVSGKFTDVEIIANISS